MAYRLRRGKDVQNSVRKVALEQIDKAIGEISTWEDDRHAVVHQVRKRCKKLRGLIRLVRPVFADYRRENAFIRDLARELSPVRDAQSIVDCFDSLMEQYRAQLDSDAFTSVREALTERRRAVTQDKIELENRLEALLGKWRELRHRAERWKIDANGYSAVEGGLTRTYRRGRRALGEAYRQPSPEHFHEWRKRAKYHWYHTRLLRDVWPDMMKVQRDAADELSALLGDDHDLAVLRQTLRADPRRFGGKMTRQALVGLIDQRRLEIEAQARPLGERLFAEKPQRLAARLGGYWEVWRA